MHLSSHVRIAIAGLASAATIAALAAAPAGAKPPPAAPTTAAPTLQEASPAISPATAQASQDAACDLGDVCLYWGSDFTGSSYDTAHNDEWLFNNHFITAGSGQASVVANNAESVWNRDPNTTLRVCTDANYTGTCGTVLPGQSGNFTSTFKNNVESIIWADSSN
jgi:hypothetical protein